MTAPDLFGGDSPVEPVVDEPQPAVEQGEQFRDSAGRLWRKVGTRGWEEIGNDQGALFDVDEFAGPDADIKAKLDARGVSAAAYLATYESATIKQIVCYFRGDDFKRMLERLRSVMRQTGAQNNSEALVKLMEHWETTHA